MTCPTPVSEHPLVRDWLETFAAAVRERDVVTGRALFAVEACGFGTVAGRYDGLDQLVEDQWRDVWPRTTGFTFALGTATCWDTPDGSLVITGWTSLADDGRERSGRATIGLARTPAGLVAAHSHFSMTPGTSS